VRVDRHLAGVRKWRLSGRGQLVGSEELQSGEDDSGYRDRHDHQHDDRVFIALEHEVLVADDLFLVEELA